MRTGAGIARRLLTGASARAVGKLFSAEVLALIAVTVQGLLTARYLGPSLYGRWSLVLGLTALALSILDLRSADAVTRFLPEHLRSRRSGAATALTSACLTADAAVSLVVAAVVAVVAATAPSLVPLPTSYVLLVVVAAVAVLPTSTARAVLTSDGRYGAVAAIQVTGVLGRLLLTLVVIGLDLALLGVLAVLAGGLAAECAVTVLLAARTLRARGSTGRLRLALPTAVAPEVRRFIGWNGAVTVSGALVKQGDLVIVGVVAGSTASGYYRLARSLAAPVGTLALPLQTVFYNKLSRARTGARIAWRTVILRAQLVVLPVVLLLIAGVPAVGGLVTLLAGDDFAEAAGPAAWLMLGGAVGLLTYWCRPVLLVLDHLRPNLFAGLVVAGLFAALAVPVARASGAEGVAVVRLAVVSGLGNLLLLELVRKAIRRDSSEGARATGTAG